MEVEGPYHKYTNAGHISYVELEGDTVNNVDAFEKVVRIMHDSDVGYGAINHPVDRDPVCGYTGIIKDKCPHCGTTLSVVTEEAIEQDKNMQSTKTTKKTEKKSNKSLIFSISIATLLVLIIGGLILLDYKNTIGSNEGI